MRKTALMLAAVGAMLAACATATVYQPQARRGDVGFSETRIEQDRYRVSFKGGSNASRAQVEDYALLRAAELTLEQGYEWFSVEGRGGEAGRRGGGGPTASLGGGGGGGSFGVGGGVGFALGAGEGPEVSLEVRLGRGSKPDYPGVYDARSVQESLRARL